jgi:hypothetical protein
MIIESGYLLTVDRKVPEAHCLEVEVKKNSVESYLLG